MMQKDLNTRLDALDLHLREFLSKKELKDFWIKYFKFSLNGLPNLSFTSINIEKKFNYFNNFIFLIQALSSSELITIKKGLAKKLIYLTFWPNQKESYEESKNSIKGFTSITTKIALDQIVLKNIEPIFGIFERLNPINFQTGINLVYSDKIGMFLRNSVLYLIISNEFGKEYYEYDKIENFKPIQQINISLSYGKDDFLIETYGVHERYRRQFICDYFNFINKSKKEKKSMNTRMLSRELSNSFFYISNLNFNKIFRKEFLKNVLENKKSILESLKKHEFDNYISTLNNLLLKELNLRIYPLENIKTIEGKSRIIHKSGFKIFRNDSEIKLHSLSIRELFKLILCIDIQFSNFLGNNVIIIDNIDKIFHTDELEGYFKFINETFKGKQLIICTFNRELEKIFPESHTISKIVK